MADPFLSIQSVEEVLRRRHRRAGLQSRRRAGRVRLLPRALGLRQDHGAAHRRRLRGADSRLDRHRRQGRHAAEAQPAQHRHGVPGLCAVPQSDGRAEHRLRPEGRRRAKAETATSASPRCSSSSSCRSSATAIPISFPAASSSVSRSRAPSRRSPKLLLLDEPLSALDAKVRVSLRDEIRAIQKELGLTTVFVTHDQEEALSISDRIVVMYGGKAEQVGTPSRSTTVRRPVRRQFRRHAERA